MLKDLITSMGDIIMFKDQKAISSWIRAFRKGRSWARVVR